MNPQAAALNALLQQKAQAVYPLLSQRGREAYFPKEGILVQTAEAAGTEVNATIGQALKEDSSPLTLDLLQETIYFADVPAEKILLYSPSHGQHLLRTAWQEHLREINPLSFPASLPIVTGGITNGLFLAGQLFIDPGDELILPSPCWENYSLVFPHAQLRYVPLFADGVLNSKGLAEALATGNTKKVVLLNFPHNPTGYTPTEEEARQIVQSVVTAAAEGKKIIVICDDAYQGLVYEKSARRESIFSLLATIHENVLAVKADGISKELYAWGLRVGFLTYGFKGMDAETAHVLEEKTAGMVRATISNASTPGQLLALQALQSAAFEQQIKKNHEVLKERYRLVREILEHHEAYRQYFLPLPFNSGYFLCIRLLKHDAQEIRKRLLKKYRTGVIAFDNLLRIAYSSLSQEKIKRVFENIYQACSSG